MRAAGLMAMATIIEILLRALRNGLWFQTALWLGAVAFSIAVLPRMLLPILYPDHEEEVRQLKEKLAREEAERERREALKGSGEVRSGSAKKRNRNRR